MHDLDTSGEILPCETFSTSSYRMTPHPHTGRKLGTSHDVVILFACIRDSISR